MPKKKNEIQKKKEFDRASILVRLIITVVCLIAFEVVKVIVQIAVLFQFAYLLITKEYSEHLRQFTNRLSTYGYRILRYSTLNENARPFPFNPFPPEKDCEAAEKNLEF